MRSAFARTWARLDPRGRAAVLGSGGLLAVLLVAVLTFGRGGPIPVPQPSTGPSPDASPSASQLSADDANALVARVLPSPSTTDTVLLVSNAANLSPTELRWLSDLRGRLGNVDPLAYRDASLDRLRRYFVVFVIDQSADLDPKVLAGAYAAGLSIHLIGPAATYRAQVAGSAP